MLQINLRKARKLESFISSACGVDSKFTNLSVLASTNDEEATNQLVSAKAALQEQNKNVLDLIKVNFSIRRKIEQANEAIGIHEKMNQRELLKKQISYLESLTESDTCEVKEMLDLLAAKRAVLAKGDNSFYGKVNVSVSVIDKQAQEALESQVNSLRKQLDDVEEELLQKNVGGKITLTAEEVEVLKSNGLV